MSETKIEFDATYQFCWLKNIGTGDCYVSDHPNIVAEDDDVAFLPIGEAVLMPMYNKAVYVLGDTVIEAHAQNFSDAPFAWNEAGEGGGSDITVESLSVDDNGTYTAPSGTAYSPVTVNVSPNVGAKTITADGTYTASTDNLDGYSSVTVDTAYHLPSAYEQLDYVECPQSAWAGFTIPNYTYKGYDILESKTMPYQVTTLAAFAGYKTSGIVMGYENSTTRLYAGQNAVDLIGTQEATVNNIYYHRGLKTVDISEFNVGYYRDDQYPFYGRIYYFRIYRCNNTSEGISMIYNFIPAKRLSDNKIGLYDAVNDTFYSSTTGTEFVAPASA